MKVHYDRINREYYIKEKLSNGQTLYLGFQLVDETYDTKYWNIYLSVYSKRKDKDKNENNHIITGKNPWESLSVGLRAFKLLEEVVLENNTWYNNIIYCFWTDNRRRSAYQRLLSKRGYSIGVDSNGYKCLVKKVVRRPQNNSN